jgi:hypothetical protein
MTKQEDQGGQGCQVPDARLPSTGLKGTKRAKRANVFVTLVTDVTLVTLSWLPATCVRVLDGTGMTLGWHAVE